MTTALQIGQKQVVELTDAGRAAMDEADRWLRGRHEAEIKLTVLRDQYAETKEVRENLVAVGEMANCPTCTRPMHDAYRSVLDLLDAQMDSLRADAHYFTQRLAQLAESPAIVSDEGGQVDDAFSAALFDDDGDQELPF